MYASWSDVGDASGQSGTLGAGHPYAKIGSGSRSLAVLPGFGDAMWPGVYPPMAGAALAPYVAAYLDEYTVYLLSRPRRLPPDYDEAQAVEGHSRAFESMEQTSGPVDVIGISMGGLIAQAVARRRPELIDRLVLANTACRLDEAAADDVRQLEAVAREGDWASIRSQLAETMFSDARSVVYPPMLQTIGRLFQLRPAEPTDVCRSLEFIRRFDGCDDLGAIDQPTFIFGGDRDPYFTERVARETADGIPNAELRLVSGAKHGAFHERKLTFDTTVRAFLDRTA